MLIISQSSLTRQMLCSFLFYRSSSHSHYYYRLLSKYKGHHFVSLTTTATEDLLSSLLNHCSNSNHLHQTHGFMLVRGLDQDNFHLSRFIDVCSALGSLDHAYSAFAHSTKSGIYLYNTMIKALSRHDNSSAKEAIVLYNEARLNGLPLDSYSFPFVLKAVVRLSDVNLGRGIHCQALCIGLDGDVSVAAALVQMYSSCGGGVSSARKVFDEMPCWDVVSWNAMVAGYAKVGDVDSARDLFEQMPERNVISWTAVLAGYTQMNRSSEALEFFRRMQLEGVQPDEVAMLAALSACADLGALEVGKWIHNYVETRRLHKTVPLQNALIDMYAKSGNIKVAVEVFKTMKQRSVVSWTTIIAGLALNGLGNEALDMFSHMERAKIMPNHVTMLAVLSACRHVGLVEMGRWYFNSMYFRYGIKPKIEHYGCMMDLLGRAGCLQEAVELLMRMPFEANGAIWGCLLAASRIHGDVDLGEIALRRLIKLEPQNSGNYSLLSNIYAALGRWNEAGMMRKVMRDTGVKKIPGGSLIDVNDRVHEFGAGDKTHPQSERIYELLLQINRQLKMAAFVDRECLDILESSSLQSETKLAWSTVKRTSQKFLIV